MSLFNIKPTNFKKKNTLLHYSFCLHMNWYFLAPTSKKVSRGAENVKTLGLCICCVQKQQKIVIAK